MKTDCHRVLFGIKYISHDKEPTSINMYNYFIIDTTEVIETLKVDEALQIYKLHGTNQISRTTHLTTLMNFAHTQLRTNENYYCTMFILANL